MCVCVCGQGILLLPSATTALRKPSKQQTLEQRGTTFLLSLSCSAFAFFLCSFQVHEKAILLPLLPVALNVNEYTAGWLLGLVGVFSMYVPQIEVEVEKYFLLVWCC